MEIEQMGSIPPKANPFSYDLYHMGTRMGSNLLIMHANHDSEICNYLILCNTDTGERWRVAITPAGKKETVCEQVFNTVGLQKLTCSSCLSRKECEFVDDPYNTNGDCLAIK
jgi:hypothetical protein